MTTERRRDGRLEFQPDDGVLVVGGRTAVLEGQPPAEVVIGTYVELVVAQRAVKPATRLDLRDRELDQLAALLQLPQPELDELIDRELSRLLEPAPAQRSRRGRVLAFGALAIVAVAVAAAAAGATGGSDHSPGGSGDGSTVETVVLPDGSTATRTESAPAPPADGVDIGTAVVYER